MLSASNTLEQSKLPVFHTFPVLVLEEIKVLLLLITKVSEIADVSLIMVFKLSCHTSINSHLPSIFGQDFSFLQAIVIKMQQINIQKPLMQ